MSARAPAVEPPGLRVHLLGGLVVVVAGTPVREQAWRLWRARTLIKLLALAPGHRLHREQVVDALWGDQAPRNPWNSLHQVVHVARQALESAASGAGHLLLFQGQQLALSPRPPQSPLTDVEAFEAAAAHARQEGSVAAYRTALALYTGDLLPEDRYEEWAAGRRESLRAQLISLLLDLARLLEQQQAWDDAVATLRRVVAADATHEEAHVHLMRLHALAGSPHEAQRQYRSLVSALEEIGMGPLPSSQQLYADIRDGRFPGPGAAPASPPAAPTGLAAVGGRATNLPSEATRFVGRARELAEVAGLLAEARVLTIAGIGGSGKTRLALHVARSLVGRFGDGVWLAELAAVGQAALVPQVVAAALHIPERAGESAVETLVAALEQKQVLLVLDNCEHLLDACSRLAETLVRRCPDVRILCTSREPLHIPGEVVWRISSLTIPDARRAASVESLTRYESVELFLERARAVRPSFALTAENVQAIVQICRRLDGLPLALELAAPLVGVLSVEQIATQLDDCFRVLTRGSRTALTRQQTLRGTLDWSYDLLTDAERTLFRRLAVFAGGFDLAAAEAVADLGASPAAETLTLVDALVDKSLVVADTAGAEAHYRLLEPIQQYAEHRLAEAGETSRVHELHCAWFSRLSKRADAALWGEGHEGAVAHLEASQDNLRAALAWRLRDSGGAEDGLRMALALWQFWLLRGAFAEGRRWIERLVALTLEPSGVRAEAFMRLVGLAIRQGAYSSEEIRAAAETSVATFDALGDAAGTSRALRMFGIQAYMAGDYDRAEAAFARSLELAHGIGAAGDEALATHALGVLAWARGEHTRAREHLTHAIERLRMEGGAWTTIALLNFPHMPFAADSSTLDLVDEETWVLLRALDAETAIGYSLAHLGSVARTEGEYARARAHLQDAQRLFAGRGDRAGLAQVAGQLGNLARVEGDYARARALLRESVRLRRALGDRRGTLISLNNLGLLAVAEGDYARAEALYKGTLTRLSALGDGSGVQMTHELQAHLAVARRDYAQARQAYEQVLEMVRAAGDATRDAAFILADLGATARAQGETVAAYEYLTRSLERFEQLRHTRNATLLREALHTLSVVLPPGR